MTGPESEERIGEAPHEGAALEPAGVASPAVVLPPGPTPDRWAHRRGEPRTFAALWLAYLFGAIAFSLGGVGLFGLLATDVYRPAARTLLTLAAVGVAVLWPMARLSQEAPKRPLRALLVDLLVMVVPVQAVIWPQAFPWMAGWPLSVAAALAGLFLAWTGLMSGLLAVYFAASQCGRFRPMPRWGMMLLVMLVVLAGPAVAVTTPIASRAAVGVDVADPWLVSSPMTAVYELTRDRSWSGQSARIGPGHWLAVGMTGLCALFSWGVAAAVGRGAEQGRSQPAFIGID